MTRRALDKQYSYICPICGNAKALAQEPDVDKITEVFGKMVNAVRNGDMTTETLPYELAEAISDELLQAVDLGLKYGQPDEAMTWMFQNSVFSFSGAKSIQELKELSAALIKDKKLVSLAEYKRIAANINTQYNINFLKTEYNSAIAAAQTGARWWEFRENEEIMPYLQYQTAGDGRVRDSHQQLNGVVKHIRDRFWTMYYPPNGWNCRCEAIQVANSDIKETEIAPEIKVPSIFKTNLAHTGVIFPDDSPYYRGINEKDILWLRPSFKKALEPVAKLKSLYPEFTRLELATMYNYTDHDFMYVNPLMKDKISNKFIATYENYLTKGLDKCKNYKGIVFRGITTNDDVLTTYIKDKTIQWDAFTSSSTKNEIAIQYIKKQKETKILFEIMSKNGKQIDNISAKGINFTKEREYEILFKSRSKFQVIEEPQIRDDGIFLIKLIEL